MEKDFKKIDVYESVDVYSASPLLAYREGKEGRIMGRDGGRRVVGT